MLPQVLSYGNIKLMNACICIMVNTLTSRSGFTIAVSLTAANLDGVSQLQAAGKAIKYITAFQTFIE